MIWRAFGFLYGVTFLVERIRRASSVARFEAHLLEHILYPSHSFCCWTVEAFGSAFVPRNTLAVPTFARTSSSSLTMKIFDWKRRTADESVWNDLDVTEFTVDTLRSAPGARKRKTRKGRGIAAGQGATCGFGMRGQKSRSGNPVRPGFEGGQNPLYRRLPKFVGQPTGPGHTKTIYNVISTDALAQVKEESAIVNFAKLQELGLATKSKWTIHKVVSGKNSNDDSVPTMPKLTVQAHAFTATARAMIEAAGGTCEILSKTTHKVLGSDNDEGDSGDSSEPASDE
jgi:large subunit ribosomal protein L15